ncbi:PEP-CTERM sorting domain-containing protein [Botrimarina hoheduenensis]|nr:PEP-CTERM sorting domain-containing protein [Botrimarina hoheduenensis]
MNFCCLPLLSEAAPFRVLGIGSSRINDYDQAAMNAVGAPREIVWDYHSLSTASLHEIAFAPTYASRTSIDLNDVQTDYDAIVLELRAKSGSTLKTDLDAVAEILRLVRQNGYNQNTRLFLLGNMASPTDPWWGLPPDLSVPDFLQPTQSRRGYYRLFQDEVVARGIADLSILTVGDVIYNALVEGADTRNAIAGQPLHVFGNLLTENGRYLNTVAFVAAIFEADPTPWEHRFDYWNPDPRIDNEGPPYNAAAVWDRYQEIVRDHITIRIVPEPGSLGMLTMVVGGLAIRSRRTGSACSKYLMQRFD